MANNTTITQWRATPASEEDVRRFMAVRGGDPGRPVISGPRVGWSDGNEAFYVEATFGPLPAG